MSGEEAASTYGLTVAQVDHAAATGLCDAQYGDGTGRSWMLMVKPKSGDTTIPVDEVQRFDILGSPGSGTFTLTFDGETTTPLGAHPAVGDVQRALEALSTIGVGNVVVVKDGGWGYVCSFGGALAGRNLPELTADDSLLGGDGSVVFTTVTQGVAGSTRSKVKKAKKT